MPGFFISNSQNDIDLINYNATKCIHENISYKQFQIKRATLNKYLDDKAFFQNETFIIITEGVILNKCELYAESNTKCIQDLVIYLYRKYGEDFFDTFRGSFSGALYDKNEEKWIVYTNHYGDNAVFYSTCSNNVYVGSQVNYIIDALRGDSFDISLNDQAVISMLTYGYMSEDFTYAREIKRIYPGHYLVIKNGELVDKIYYSIKPKKYDLSTKSESEIIDELDRRFRRAVSREYEKDIEYNYQHLAALSGGLDSRMALWVACDLGYHDITCITYGQSNCMDEKIAKQVAYDRQVELIVCPLDSLKHLIHVDEYISMNYGSAIYSGIGGEKEILDRLDTSKFGLMHTGQVGDVVIGSFLQNSAQMDDFTAGGMYSTRLVGEIENKLGFKDREEYLLFVRGFMGCLSSHFYVRAFTEVASPFLDIDLFDYCLSIPVELRADHKIYKKWILIKYPHAADFIWERTGVKILQENRFKCIRHIRRRLLNLIENPKLLLRKFGFRIHVTYKQYEGMNPYDLWWNKNEFLRDYFDSYYIENIGKLGIGDELKMKFDTLYQKGTVSEKMQVITAISALQYYKL